MNIQSDTIAAFWSSYLESRGQSPEDAGGPPEAWGFGDSPEMADDLGRLVVNGIKTATCSLLWEYEADGETLPAEGDLSIILDGSGRPLCLIETTEVRTRAYDEVDAQFAYDEGEGDRSLAYWRDAHWRYFSRLCQTVGRTPSHSMPLVYERFMVVYRPP
ncbi:MAG: ASCH domain-containing protein [Chloroflexota bacterium]|nr:MAG: ASCH domain-containing protein [Chloroflexota bacterium]